ncbi:MAG TPA: UpxY family transcription antiterminator [Chitinophaga sp.]|uniref:UpxY family transcription antiterminator n=1 Tax=Chitinophaga tropicalis TaxID=2683588 RepID=A0A7K1UBF6_9BACT|nr:UpxY family transcription antiterminator [Chitinophaga tropicalis]MVT11714.1 UpxY family transcription antiterminator [Chitinophaga tropicalis]HJT72809.1 UpxY family transcription antiterminator [Chitinophaga sp.]
MEQKTNTWYALYTKPRWEKKVADTLARKQIESYCPLNRVTHQWSDRKKVVEEPLFKSYVFVRIPEDMKTAVRETSGVVNFVYWLGKPARIPDHEIELIQRFLQEYQDVEVERFPIHENDLIQITAGPLMHQRGRVVETGKNTVKAVLYSMGFSLIATVKTSEVMLLNRSNEYIGAPVNAQL